MWAGADTPDFRQEGTKVQRYFGTSQRPQCRLRHLVHTPVYYVLPALRLKSDPPEGERAGRAKTGQGRGKKALAGLKRSRLPLPTRADYSCVLSQSL